MRHRISAFVFVATVAFASCGGENKPAPPPAPREVAAQLGPAVDAITIIMDGTAATDGELRLDFTPEGGETEAAVGHEGSACGVQNRPDEEGREEAEEERRAERTQQSRAPLHRLARFSRTSTRTCFRRSPSSRPQRAWSALWAAGSR